MVDFQSAISNLVKQFKQILEILNHNAFILQNVTFLIMWTKFTLKNLKYKIISYLLSWLYNNISLQILYSVIFLDFYNWISCIFSAKFENELKF